MCPMTFIKLTTPLCTCLAYTDLLMVISILRFIVNSLKLFLLVTDAKQQVLTPQLNHISLKLPSVPMLPGRDHLDVTKFCNRSTIRDCLDKHCECTHVLQVRPLQLPKNDLIQLIVLGPTEFCRRINFSG